MGEYMWNLSHEEYEVPASGANTETRFGEAVSEGTFPIFVDEIEKALETHSQLLSIIKTSVQNKTAQKIKRKGELPLLQPSYLRPILNLL